MESTLCLQLVNEVGGRPEGQEGREARFDCSTRPQGRLQLTLQCFCARYYAQEAARKHHNAPLSSCCRRAGPRSIPPPLALTGLLR